MLAGLSYGFELPENGGTEPFYLVKHSSAWGGEATTILVLRKDSSYLERSAAHEFVGYVHRAAKSRILMPIAYGKVPDGWKGSAVIFGVAGLSPFDDIKPKDFPAHGFRIITGKKRLYVIGASEQGASNALYWLLREKIGVRWYMPTRLGEKVPVLDDIIFEAMDTTTGPNFTALTTNSLGVLGPHFYYTSGNKTGGGMGRDSMFRHIWDQIVRPSEENKKNHPEWFALTDRKELPGDPDKDWMLKFLWKDSQGRIRSNQLCTTNPDVARRYISSALRHFRENPDSKMFSLSPNDYHEFCTCQNCRALDKKLGNGPIMNRFMTLFNQVAAGIKTEFPDKLLGIQAYSSHVDAPTNVMPDPMIMPILCFFASRACYQHAIDDFNCPTNVAWKQQVFDPWVKISSGVSYYSYYGYSGNWQGPQLSVRTLPQDLKLIKKHNGYKVHYDGFSNWATSAPLYYLIARLSWDVDADSLSILDEWYHGVYGPAYAPMKQYWETMIEAYYSGPCRSSSSAKNPLSFTPKVIERAWGHIRDAEKIVSDRLDKYQRFVAIARAGLEYTDAIAQGYALANDGNYTEAVVAGERALKVIKDSRMLQPGPYTRPMLPREERNWLWYTYSKSVTSEARTQRVIQSWRKRGKNFSPIPSRLLTTLPKHWQFRKDEQEVGEKEEWFNAGIENENWQPISTHRSWTKSFPGYWHGTGWYRLDFSIEPRYLETGEEDTIGKLLIYFGAIDGWAKVYLNGQLVGQHTEGPEKMWNQPWHIDITEAVEMKGINHLAVSVTKQSAAAGIWKPVQLREIK